MALPCSRKGDFSYYFDTFALINSTDVNSVVCRMYNVNPEPQKFFGGYTFYGNSSRK